MGGETQMQEAPIFSVRAVGWFVAKAGLSAGRRGGARPRTARAAVQGRVLPPRRRAPADHADRDRADRSAGGARRRSRVPDRRSVARLRRAGPTRRAARKTFSDPEFPDLERGVLYYARAYEAPEPAINAGNLRCERDSEGNCTKDEPVPGARRRHGRLSRAARAARVVVADLRRLRQRGIETGLHWPGGCFVAPAWARRLT